MTERRMAAVISSSKSEPLTVSCHSSRSLKGMVGPRTALDCARGSRPLRAVSTTAAGVVIRASQSSRIAASRTMTSRRGSTLASNSANDRRAASILRQPPFDRGQYGVDKQTVQFILRCASQKSDFVFQLTCSFEYQRFVPLSRRTITRNRFLFQRFEEQMNLKADSTKSWRVVHWTRRGEHD